MNTATDQADFTFADQLASSVRPSEPDPVTPATPTGVVSDRAFDPYRTDVTVYRHINLADLQALCPHANWSELAAAIRHGDSELPELKLLLNDDSGEYRDRKRAMIRNASIFAVALVVSLIARIPAIPEMTAAWMSVISQPLALVFFVLAGWKAVSLIPARTRMNQSLLTERRAMPHVAEETARRVMQARMTRLMPDEEVCYDRVDPAYRDQMVGLLAQIDATRSANRLDPRLRQMRDQVFSMVGRKPEPEAETVTGPVLDPVLAGSGTWSVYSPTGAR